MEKDIMKTVKFALPEGVDPMQVSGDLGGSGYCSRINVDTGIVGIDVLSTETNALVDFLVGSGIYKGSIEIKDKHYLR